MAIRHERMAESFVMALAHRAVRPDIDIISAAVILSQLQRTGTIVAKSLLWKGPNEKPGFSACAGSPRACRFIGLATRPCHFRRGNNDVTDFEIRSRA